MLDKKYLVIRFAHDLSYSFFMGSPTSISNPCQNQAGSLSEAYQAVVLLRSRYGIVSFQRSFFLHEVNKVVDNIFFGKGV